MSDDRDAILPAALRAFRSEFARERSQLVPEAFQILLQPARRHILYGGRASGKSWSVARVLLVQAFEQRLRVLSCREFQSSVRESALRLLADQVHLLGLSDHFQVRADSIIGRNGSEFIFEGLRYNDSRLRSLEAVDVCWIEEGQSVSELSWETLGPTVLRKPGSRLVVTFNPITRSDPVHRRYVENPPPGTLVRKVSYLDNPHFSAESESERAWLERVDPDAHRHVWLGFPRTVSDALILKGKYFVESFAVQPKWSGPHFGLDFGFAADPSAAVRCWIDDEERVLYVDAEFWGLHVDIDSLPRALEQAIPNIGLHVVFADSSRPESVSYLARNGIPNARSAEKWPGSVDDGLAFLRSFARIVIDPSCKHLIDEAGTYSFKCDRLTGVPLPSPEDRNNHCVDALRYSLSTLIRNQPTGGYFNRSALLVQGEPLEGAGDLGRPMRVFATVADCERLGTAVGIIYWADFRHVGLPLCVLDYGLVEIDGALGNEWLFSAIARAQDLRKVWNPVQPLTGLYVEDGELFRGLAAILLERLMSDSQVLAGYHPPYDLICVDQKEVPGTLDQRTSGIRATVNGGKFVKLERTAYANQVTHRSVTANHLLSQLLGYRHSARDAAAELVNAFVVGVLISQSPDERPTSRG